MTRMRNPPHPGAFIRTEIVAPRAVGDDRGNIIGEYSSRGLSPAPQCNQLADHVGSIWFSFGELHRYGADSGSVRSASRPAPECGEGRGEL